MNIYTRSILKYLITKANKLVKSFWIKRERERVYVKLRKSDYEY